VEKTETDKSVVANNLIGLPNCTVARIKIKGINKVMHKIHYSGLNADPTL
jgi:hypothetical protein